MHNVKLKEESTTVPVRRVVINENFNFENRARRLNRAFDLALLELAEDVDLATFTPVCLAREDDLNTFDNKMAEAAGDVTDFKIP